MEDLSAKYIFLVEIEYGDLRGSSSQLWFFRARVSLAGSFGYSTVSFALMF